MKPMQIIAALLFVPVALFYGGCTDTAPSGPVTGLGGVTVNKYVAIGDSYAAGYQSNALYESGQKYSYPSLIAQQLMAAGANLGTFELPIYSDPGNPDPKSGTAARYEILKFTYNALTNKYDPTIAPRPGLAPGAPTNLALTHAYDNLGIPGSVVFDFLDTTSFAVKAGPPRDNPFFQLVLRNPALGNNILSQASALHPNLVTFWLGGNDVLGYATSGGFSPSAPTPTAAFGALYTQALNALAAALPNAKVVVGSVANVDALPFFTTIGPKVAGALAAKSAQYGFPVYLRYQKHGNTSVAFDSTQLTEAHAPMILLTGSQYAPLIGSPGGKWYADNAYPGLPPGIDTTKPFGVHPQNPWPDALVLDADEQANTAATVDAYNNIIFTTAAAHGFPVVDFNTFWNNLRAHGLTIAGQKFTPDYIAGGMFSLDGVHPSSRGYAILANQFIKVMNEKFGMGVPYVDVGTIPGLTAPLGKNQGDYGIPYIPHEAFADFDWLFGGGRY
jgi:lysophospholipase L1-like esterase